MRRPRSSRSVLIVAAVAAVVLLVVTIAALAARSPASLPPGTPEATAQGYVRAVIDGEEDTAIGFLADALRDDCTAADLRDAYRPESVRVHLVETSVSGDTALVDLLVEEGGGGIGSGYGYEVTLEMERRAGSWVIAEPPWPMEFCAEAGP